MSGRPRAAYPEIVNPAPGIAAHSAPTLARAAARRAWRGLIQVLIGPEPAPAWRWRSPAECRGAYVALGLATLALCVINAGTIHGVASMHASLTPPITPPTNQLPPTLGQRLLAVAVVAPLPLAAWYPMLAWRIGWLALLLSPLIPTAWWGGWPWGPPGCSPCWQRSAWPGSGTTGRNCGGCGR
jgi:hypothetical protein